MDGLPHTPRPLRWRDRSPQRQYDLLDFRCTRDDLDSLDSGYHDMLLSNDLSPQTDTLRERHRLASIHRPSMREWNPTLRRVVVRA